MLLSWRSRRTQDSIGTFSVIRHFHRQLSGCCSDLLDNLRAADYNSQVTELTLSGDFSAPPPTSAPLCLSDTPTSHLLSISLAQNKEPCSRCQIDLGFFAGEAPELPLAFALPLLLAALTLSEIPTLCLIFLASEIRGSSRLPLNHPMTLMPRGSSGCQQVVVEVPGLRELLTGLGSAKIFFSTPIRSVFLSTPCSLREFSFFSQTNQACSYMIFKGSP